MTDNLTRSEKQKWLNNHGFKAKNYDPMLINEMYAEAQAAATLQGTTINGDYLNKLYEKILRKRGSAMLYISHD